MIELNLEKRFTLEARKRRFIVKKGNAFELKGIPDREVLMFNGVSVYVELKVRNNKLSPEQILWEKELKERGFNHVVVRSEDDFQKVWDFNDAQVKE